ncbi:MAG: putative monovalent cation/H+ antiporter subunit A [Bacteroidales bacterium]|nr:putative monovalent cation/H+ antiporter subunit A [Bacteroidales bacterium]
MITAILAGFIAAIAAPYIHKAAPRLAGYFLTLVPLSIFAYLGTYIPAIANGEIISSHYKWFPELNIHIGFLIDGLSLTFALIISGIGALIVFYGSSYLHGHKKLGRFYGYTFFFMASMLGVVLSDNLITLFIFWELTSISSYLLIGFNHESEKARNAALQALLVTGGGGLALLAGMIIMGFAGGSFNISDLLSQHDAIISHELYFAMLFLIFWGAFSKSAQFPFHFWLPSAMEAPTPVSAYLHSATMVKAGVYLLARLNPAIGGTEPWTYTLLIFGGITMVLGAVQALGQTDLKRILAYTTVSALGILVFLIGIGTQTAITAAIIFLVIHALYKGSLFLVAGAIDHETGTRDVRFLGGLGKKLPYVMIAAVLAALSYAGLPPLLGFIGKEMIYESTLHGEGVTILLTTIAVLVNMLLVATAIIVGIKPFFGPFRETPKHPHHAPFRLWFPPMLLASLGLIFGIFPSLLSETIIAPAASASMGTTFTANLHLWHGFNLSLLLSVLTLLGGFFFFYIRSIGRQINNFYTSHSEYLMESVYYKVIDRMVKFASWQTKFFQDGYLRHYIYWMMTTVLVIGFLSLFSFVDLSVISLTIHQIYLYEILIVVVLLLAAFFAIKSKSVLGAVASIGITGYGVALIFVFYGAPDLALTQFSIETLTVVLLVLIAYKIPRFASYSSKSTKIRDAVISISVGSFITVILLVLLSSEPPETISHYFLDNSYILAHGRNVVNVILVDFRALDTMGEITVLSIAAVGVITLLKLRMGKEKKDALVKDKQN